LTPPSHRPQEAITRLSETVADPGAGESQEPVASTAPATPSTEDAATLLKRLAGKDQAYTRLKTDYEATTSELAALRNFKREAELSQLTEADRYKRELDDTKAELAQAKAEATREKLARKYPTAFDALGDAAPLDEKVLEKLEAKLKPAADETDDEPYVDPNSPRRNTRRPQGDPSDPTDRLRIAHDKLVAAGNPYARDEWK
jgi:hypothetical protein